MQKHVNLVDLVKSFPTNIFLQNLASIQKRTSPLKFAHLAEKSGNGSIPNLSTKVRVATDEAALEDYTFEEVSCMNKTVSYGVGTERGWETCSVGQPQGQTWAAFCDSKVVYSKKFKRFVKCQY